MNMIMNINMIFKNLIITITIITIIITLHVEYTSTIPSPISTRPELQSSFLQPFDFLLLIATASSQLRQDNQLLLLLHRHVIELETAEGQAILAEEREQAHKEELETLRNRVDQFIDEYCALLSDEDAIAFLLVRYYYYY